MDYAIMSSSQYSSYCEVGHKIEGTILFLQPPSSEIKMADL